MNARDIMTTEVVSVSPETPARKIAELLGKKGISAVPVVDSAGAPIGMVSEGDLIGRDETEREARRDWWLTLLAEGEALNPDFLAALRSPERVARDVMSAPVVTVGEETDINEIAQLLTAYRIKRVPVVRDGRIVGIVSRADLVRALAAEPSPAAKPTGGLLSGALVALDQHFRHRHDPADQVERAEAPRHHDDGRLTVADFRSLAADAKHKEAEHREKARRTAAAGRRQRVKDLIEHHVSDESWRALLHHAREAAEHGQKEFMLLRFPNQLCSDGGRAINVTDPGWPATLRGEAAEIYLRWERDLRAHGFHLAARVIEFPGGMPGDIGLFLVWGE
jgi:CBS domain-containing protein